MPCWGMFFFTAYYLSNHNMQSFMALKCSLTIWVMFWHNLTKNSRRSQYFVLNGVVTHHLIMVRYPRPGHLIMVTYPPHPMLPWLPSASLFSWWTRVVCKPCHKLNQRDNQCSCCKLDWIWSPRVLLSVACICWATPLIIPSSILWKKYMLLNFML